MPHAFSVVMAGLVPAMPKNEAWLCDNLNLK
jgi:hypothetical protein